MAFRFYRGRRRRRRSLGFRRKVFRRLLRRIGYRM